MIHTPTKAEAGELLRILHGCGYEWSDHKPLTGNTYWETYGEDTVYIACAGLVDKADMSAQTEWRGHNPIYTFADVKKLFCTEEPDNDAPLNLCELLKEHEKSFFVSQCYGQIELKEIKDNKLIIQDMVAQKHTLASDGIHYPCGSSCIIYPSRALYEQYPLDPYTAWMKWKEEQKKEYGLGIVLQNMNPKNCEVINGHTLLFHTPADREKCLSEIQAIIEKYSI